MFSPRRGEESKGGREGLRTFRSSAIGWLRFNWRQEHGGRKKVSVAHKVAEGADNAHLDDAGGHVLVHDLREVLAHVGLELLEEDAVGRDLALDLAVGGAGHAEAHGARRAVARQTHLRQEQGECGSPCVAAASSGRKRGPVAGGGAHNTRTTRTSWQKYLPPNCAPMPIFCVSSSTWWKGKERGVTGGPPQCNPRRARRRGSDRTFFSISTSRKARPWALPVVGRLS